MLRVQVTNLDSAQVVYSAKAADTTAKDSQANTVQIDVVVSLYSGPGDSFSSGVLVLRPQQSQPVYMAFTPTQDSIIVSVTVRTPTGGSATLQIPDGR